MIIKKIYIKNIRSYREATIEFPSGSTLLMGDIGSGKTSILLAIEFALFGLQPGQKGNSLIRSNEDEAYVKLELEIDEDIIVIERGLKKSSKSVNQTDTSITINNSRYEGSVTEIKNKVLELLSYPSEFAKKTNDLYRFTVYTPQEEMKQIILESNDTRLNTLRHVFGIDKYKRIEENIDIITARLRQEIRVKEFELGNIEQKKVSLSEKKTLLSEREGKAEEVEEIILSVRREKEKKQAEIDALTKQIEEKSRLQTEKAKSEMALITKKDIANTYEREIKILKEEIEKSSKFSYDEQEVGRLKAKIADQEKLLKTSNEEYIKLATEIQTQESQTKSLKTLSEKISSLNKCPTCLQLVPEEYKMNIVTKATGDLRDIEKNMQENKKRKEKLQSEIETGKKLLETLKSSLSGMEILKIKLENLKEKQKRLEQRQKDKEMLSSDINMIKKHIESLDKTIHDFRAYDAQYELRNKEIREIIQRENYTLIKRAEMNKEIQFLQQQIEDIENEIKKIENAKEKLAYLREMEFWLNNKFLELILHTEKNVMLKLREDFSKLFSEWFSLLVSDAITVRLDESFSPIIQQADYEVDYAYLSGGERTAVALAYRLALNQVINSLLSKIKTRDLVILDEPTDGFSETQLDRMREVLHQLQVKQLILVSHEQKVESFVENIIRFKKTEGITNIEV